MEKILLVEDDDLDAMALERALSKAYHSDRLVRAKDGVEALEYLRGENGKDAMQKPFMMLLDLNMPRMNGIELLENIRDDATLSDCVIFVLTTSASVNDRVAAYDKNVAGYIVKSDTGDGYARIVKLLEDYFELVTLPYKAH